MPGMTGHAALGTRLSAAALEAVAERTLAAADVLLFPSLHDSAGWAVGEAAAVGCAVVCLDIGGPPLLGGPDALVVRPGRGVVARLAAAVAEAARAPVRPYPRWQADRLTALVDDWYASATT